MTARIPAALPDHHEDRTSYPYPLQTHANYWKTYQIRLKSLLPDPRLAPISTLHEPNSLSHQSLADRGVTTRAWGHLPPEGVAYRSDTCGSGFRSKTVPSNAVAIMPNTRSPLVS